MKKRSKIDKKVLYILSPVFVGVLLALIVILVSSNPKQLKVSKVDTSSWETFSDSQTGISFKHPTSLPVRVTSSVEGVNKTYTVEVPKLNNDYAYRVAEAHESATTFTIDIYTDSTKPDYPDGVISDSFVKLASDDQTYPMFGSNGYNYVFLKSGKQWQNQSYVLQCKEQQQCRARIDRQKQPFQYINADISGIEGWRNGGNPIDFNSLNYRIAEAIIKTLKF